MSSCWNSLRCLLHWTAECTLQNNCSQENALESWVCATFNTWMGVLGWSVQWKTERLKSSQFQTLDHIFLLRKQENVTVKPLQIIRSGTANTRSSFTSPAPSLTFMLLNCRHIDISLCNGKHAVLNILQRLPESVLVSFLEAQVNFKRSDVHQKKKWIKTNVLVNHQVLIKRKSAKFTALSSSQIPFLTPLLPYYYKSKWLLWKHSTIFEDTRTKMNSSSADLRLDMTLTELHYLFCSTFGILTVIIHFLLATQFPTYLSAVVQQCSPCNHRSFSAG